MSMFNAAGQAMQAIGQIQQVKMEREITNERYYPIHKERSFEYDQRKWWEILLRRPKKMKKVIYEVDLQFHN